MSTTDTNPIDVAELLGISDRSESEQEELLRTFRIKTIDKIIAELKKAIDKEEQQSLNRFLRMCPRIDDLIAHLQNEHKQPFTKLLKEFASKPPFVKK